MTMGLVFCLLYMKINDPRTKMTTALEKLYLKVLKNYVRFMYIDKASLFFDLIRNKDLPNTLVDLEFIVVYHIFLGGQEGLYLSIFCESQQIFNTVLWRLARSHRSLDNSFHRWHILLFIPFLSKNVSFGGFDPGYWLCRHACVPMYYAYDFISTNHMVIYIHVYKIMHTASCALRLSHIKRSK